VVPRTGLDSVEKKKKLTLPGIELVKIKILINGESTLAPENERIIGLGK
jgi:hypothetical protein